ncbi:MAG: hypothetical protein AAF328_00460 [Planctomycetota bacterium]
MQETLESVQALRSLQSGLPQQSLGQQPEPAPFEQPMLGGVVVPEPGVEQAVSESGSKLIAINMSKRDINTPFGKA